MSECKHTAQEAAGYVFTTSAGIWQCPWCEIERLRGLMKRARPYAQQFAYREPSAAAVCREIDAALAGTADQPSVTLRHEAWCAFIQPQRTRYMQCDCGVAEKYREQTEARAAVPTKEGVDNG